MTICACMGPKNDEPFCPCRMLREAQERVANSPATTRDLLALANRIRALETNTAPEPLEQMVAIAHSMRDRLEEFESSVCSCPDCVMHREKARHTAPAKGVGVTPTPSEEAPAWQRAKVGDQVEWSIGDLIGIGTVTFIADPHNGCRLCLGIHGWVDNLDVLTVLPPEPAAPVQDVRERVAAALRKACLEQFGSTWSNDVSGQFADVAISTIGLAGAPQPLTIDWNTALDAYYLTARAENGTASDALMAVLKLVPGLKVEA